MRRLMLPAECLVGWASQVKGVSNLEYIIKNRLWIQSPLRSLLLSVATRAWTQSHKLTRGKIYIKVFRALTRSHTKQKSEHCTLARGIRSKTWNWERETLKVSAMDNRDFTRRRFQNGFNFNMGESKFTCSSDKHFMFHYVACQISSIEKKIL